MSQLERILDCSKLRWTTGQKTARRMPTEKTRMQLEKTKTQLERTVDCSKLRKTTGQEAAPRTPIEKTKAGCSTQ